MSPVMQMPREMCLAPDLICLCSQHLSAWSLSLLLMVSQNFDLVVIGLLYKAYPDGR